jgi:hypothetical protein
MKLKIDLNLPKLARFRVAFELGLEVGARIDVKLRLRGRDPLRWKAALAAERGAAKELPEASMAPELGQRAAADLRSSLRPG